MSERNVILILIGLFIASNVPFNKETVIHRSIKINGQPISVSRVRKRGEAPQRTPGNIKTKVDIPWCRDSI